MRNFCSVIACLLTLMAPATAAGQASEAVIIRWDGHYAHNRPAVWDNTKPDLDTKNIVSGWTTYFNAGSPPEAKRIEKDGVLDATLYRASDKPTPFVVWMHGCTGMVQVVKDWTIDLAQALNGLGIGLLVVNSYSRRFVLATCGSPDPHWGRRRADDAASALDYLIDQKLAKPRQVFIMGQSNGGLSAMNAVAERMKDRRNRFTAAFAMEPQCGSMKQVTFYAPIFFLLAEKDEANRADICIDLIKKKHAFPMQAVVLKGAYHSYMFAFPQTTVTYGDYTWREGYDGRAASLGMQAIVDFFKDPRVAPKVEYK